MVNKLLPKLSENLLETLDDDEYYDITIEVGNDPSIGIFRAHKVILYYRFPYLREILSNNKKKNGETLTHIKLAADILPETFEIVLRYIYGGRLFLEDYNDSDIIQTLIAANELNLQDLVTYIVSFLIENKANWIKQNFDLINQISNKNDSFLELQKYCIDLISKEQEVKEVPPKNINSEIVTFQHFELISKWIDKLEVTDKIRNTCEFRLILRETFDEFTPEKFHKVCDDQSHTVTIIKVKGSDEILGGYNPTAWISNFGSDITTRDSFIFSFKNHNIENHILSRVVDEKSAINNGSNNGPSFGYRDLYLVPNNLGKIPIYCKKKSYEKLIRETVGYGGEIEIIEVFQIV